MTRQEAEATIDALYRTWGRSLVRYAIAWTKCRESAEDIVQEAFFSLYTKLMSGEAVNNPRAWTLAVVRHLAAKDRRDKARRATQSLGEEDNLLAADSAVESDIAAIECFRQMLEALSEREEEALLLRMESLSYSEIAIELDVSPGTVATLLSRALAKIRRIVASGAAHSQSQLARRDIGPRSLQ